MIFLFFTLTLGFAEVPTTPCRLPDLKAFDLSKYVGISHSLADGNVGKSVLYATANDPKFDMDYPIEYRFFPSLKLELFVMILHHEATTVTDGSVGIIEIIDFLSIDLAGNVSGNQECNLRLGMVEGALRKMQEVYGF